MAKKTVRVTVPENIEELTETAGTMLTRNDGVAPAPTSPNAIVLDLAARLGLSVSIAPVSPTTPPTPPPGTNLIPANLITPLRTLYPQLARDVANLAVLNDMAEALSTSVVQRLGLGAGQTNENANTVRAHVSRIIPVLKSLLAGNENEMESYGVSVTLGTASTGGGTPPPTPPPTP